MTVERPPLKAFNKKMKKKSTMTDNRPPLKALEKQ